MYLRTLVIPLLLLWLCGESCAETSVSGVEPESADWEVSEAMLYGDESGEADYAYGTVTEVNSEKREISIIEYDWEVDMDVKTTFAIDPEAGIEGASSLSDIAAGDYIDVEYLSEEDGRKAAKHIIVYKTGPADVLQGE